LNSGEILKEKRLEKKMSQADVASEVGVHVATINKYELNKRRPSPEVAQKLGKLFDFEWTIFYVKKSA
jgi:transcriptional regulator with XRE-family HTH domain